MRGKRWMVLLVVAMLAVFAGTGQAATIWFNEVNLDQWVAGKGSYSWQHKMPLDLQVPPLSNLVSATLDIFYGTAAAKGQVTVNGDIVGGGIVFNWPWGGIVDAPFDIASTLNPWTAGTEFLDVTVGGKGLIYLSKSDLTIEYNSAPVPEPGTMILLGSGLVGLAGWGRKKFRK